MKDSPSKVLLLLPGVLLAAVALALLAFGLIERRRVADILKETTLVAEETLHEAKTQEEAYRKLQLRIGALEAENRQLRERLAQAGPVVQDGEGGAVVVGAGTGRVRPIGQPAKPPKPTREDNRKRAIPPAVLAAVAQVAGPGYRIDDIDRDKDDGVLVYEIDLEDNPIDELVVAADGTILLVQREIAFAEAPEPVRAAVAGFVGTDELVDVEVRANDHRGVVEYEVKGEAAAGKFVAELRADGTMMQARVDLAWHEVDNAIREVAAAGLNVETLTDDMVRSCRRRFDADRPIGDIYKIHGRVNDTKFELSITDKLVLFGFNHGRQRQPGPVTNTVCPVSGEMINPENSVLYKGRVIAFHDKSPDLYRFAQDPEAFLDKLPKLPAQIPDSPVNKVCPVSGRELAGPENGRTLLYDGRLIAFRSGDHLRKFLLEPDRYAANLPE
jgi:hypothetical protein